MLRRPPIALALLAALPVLLAACNAVTGVEDLMPLPPLVAAKGVKIQEIAVYQGVKRSLVGGMAPSSGVTVPIVAGRPALLRVFAAIDASYDRSEVTAHLTLGKDPPIEVVGVVSDGDDESLASTINFEIPAEKMAVDQTFRVELLQPPTHANGDNPAASYPATGTAPLDVKSDGAQLKLVIVPIRYGADGSNRLPDTSQKQLDGYKNSFFGTYPVANVEISVHEPWQWNQPISPDGTGWSEVLDAMATFRQKDLAAPDVYYFGAFEPSATFDQFCSGGCVAGLGMVGSPQDTYSRAAVGIGFSGDLAWTTAIHEVGHTQGRNHSPCGGAQNVDPAFPYPNADIGVWGYDLVGKNLIGPSQGKDLMGYCDPYWVSDYTYAAIFERMKFVNKAAIVVPDALRNRTWERAHVDAKGGLTWLSPVTLELPPAGTSTPVVEQRAGSATVVDGQFLPYDHLPGGVLLWPQATAPIAGIRVTLPGSAGQAATLAR